MGSATILRPANRTKCLFQAILLDDSTLSTRSTIANPRRDGPDLLFGRCVQHIA